MQLPWLEPADPFPSADEALGPDSPAPGLLCAGGALDVDTLRRAYAGGIFPWFSEGQPILWWSTSPRMVLRTAEFRLHRSLRRSLQSFVSRADCEIRFDTAFSQVIRACAGSARPGQAGTWIVPDMVEAYERLHVAGSAHSVETWIGGELAGGLYCVNLGRGVFGESMFTRLPDASKIALSALVAFCRAQDIALIDCQQNTAHLASLGAREMPRHDFIAHLAAACTAGAPEWRFEPLYWKQLLPQKAPA